jgi:hypothetical protein
VAVPLLSYVWKDKKYTSVVVMLCLWCYSGFCICVLTFIVCCGNSVGCLLGGLLHCAIFSYCFCVVLLLRHLKQLDLYMLLA